MTVNRGALVALLVASGSIGLSACTEEPPPIEVDAAADAGVDAGAQDGGTDAGPPGPTYPIDVPCDDPCDIRWRELEPFDRPIDHHTTFVLQRADGPYLYVLGGIEADRLGSSIQSYNARLSAAPIRPDGTLGAWEHQEFGYALAFHAQAQYIDSDRNDALWWIGGLIHDSSSADLAPSGNGYSFLGRFAPDTAGSGIAGMYIGGTPPGSVAALSGRLANPVLHGTAAMRARADGRDLFLIGGSRGQTFTNEVLRYDQTMQQWVADAPLPSIRSHHALIEHGGRLYLLGGFRGSATQPEGEAAIWRSIHDEATGRITGWEEAGTMSEPPWTASAFVRDGDVYLVGGGISGGHHGDGEFLDRVRRAPIGADGRIGEFEDFGRLPLARSHVHQTPLHGDYLYSVGGRVRASGGLAATARIFVGTLRPNE